MKKGFLVPFTLTLIGLLIALLKPSFFEILEGKLYDIHFALRGPVAVSDQIVIAVIDEKTIAQVGRWPWPRAVYAHLFEEILNQGAKVVAPDIFFSDPSLGEEGAANDAALASTLRKFPEIYTGYFFFLTPEELKESSMDRETLGRNFIDLQNDALEVDFRPEKATEAFGIQNMYAPFSRDLGDRRQGFFNILHESDGTVRNLPLLISHRGKIFPAFPLQIALGTIAKEGGPILFLKKLRLDPQGRFLINFRGQGAAFTRVSASDILNQDQTTILKDRIVLVGATAAGLEDQHPTPVNPAMASVNLAANVLDNMIRGDLLRHDSVAELASSLLILFMGTILALSLPRLKAAWGFLLFLGLSFAQAFLLHFVFIKFQWVLQNIYPLFSGFLVYSGTTLYRYFGEEKEKRFISETFQHYLSPDVIRELTDNPQKLRLGGEKKELTVFFSDIRDFSSMVESTPPETLVGFLNSYLTPVTDIILDNKGLLDKYIGDAIMAVFGAPLQEPDHPRLACQSAIDTIKFVKLSQDKWVQEFGVPRLQIGIGINTGPMTVGNMGSERRFDYTVLGDAVNLASRLEGLNKYYKTSILISQSTHEKVQGDFLFRELDNVQVKGKQQSVRLYELLADPLSAQEKMLPLFGEGRALYQRGEFKKARSLFEKCLILDPKDGPSQLFVERCLEYEKHPPEDWEGVTIFKVK
ncbi:MAG: CHASE2 domain-containing protein [Deltaproteobacteria bacterium]|nr:CHASE2 domain-containing protein [Deltaproteobacteria bacterium]